MPFIFDIHLIRLPDQSHTHAHEHHQLVTSLTGCAESEANDCGGEVYRMCACLVPGKADHVFAGVDDNRMLITDLGENNPAPEDPDLLARPFEASRYPILDVDFQNLSNYAGAELARYGSDPLPTRAPDGVSIHALHLHLFGEQQLLATSGSLDLEHLDAHIVRNLARRITVTELVQVVCFSLSHFHARSKDNVGLTPYQYLFKVRLDYTARLLRESRLLLVRVAKGCGSSSQSVLTIAMRRYLGLTPKSLRKG